MLFRRISLTYIMTGFCIFMEEMFFLEIVLKTKDLWIALGTSGCSSMA